MTEKTYVSYFVDHLTASLVGGTSVRVLVVAFLLHSVLDFGLEMEIGLQIKITVTCKYVWLEYVELCRFGPLVENKNDIALYRRL